MIDPRAKYETALAAFAAPGARWANKCALTYWGKAAGLSADEIIADVRAQGVNDRDADIRRGWTDAQTRDAATTANHTRRARKPPPQYVHHVRNLIGGMGDCGSDAVRELSPCLDWLGKPPPNQTAMFMRAAFAPGEMVHVFRRGGTPKPPPPPPRDETPIVREVFAAFRGVVIRSAAEKAVRDAVNADRRKATPVVKDLGRNECRDLIDLMAARGIIRVLPKGTGGTKGCMCGLPDVVERFLNPPLIDVPTDDERNTPGTVGHVEPPTFGRSRKRNRGTKT